MKSFIEHLSESNDHADKIAFHKEKANWHSDKAKYHKEIVTGMEKAWRDHKTPAPTIMSHSIAEGGHKDAAKYHSYAATMYSSGKIEAAKDFARDAERASNAANNRSKSLE